jgi:hypothetical protein
MSHDEGTIVLSRAHKRALVRDLTFVDDLEFAEFIEEGETPHFVPIDDFNNNSIGAGWDNWGGAQVTETSQRLNLTTTLAAGYYGIQRTDTWDVAGRHIGVHVVSAGNQSLITFGAYPVIMSLSSANEFYWFITNNLARCNTQVAGVTVNRAEFTYVPATHKYFAVGIVEGELQWSWSTDGLTWTVTTTLATPFGADTVGVPYIMIGTDAVEASTTTLQLDDFGFYTVASEISEVTLTPATAAFTGVTTTPVPGPVTVTPTTATAAFTGVAVAASPTPGAVTLTVATAARTGVAVTPVPGAVTVTLTVATAARTGVAVTPVPGAVTVTLTVATAARTGVAVTPVPQPVSVTVTPATAAFTAVAVDAVSVGGLTLTVATAAFTGVAVTPAPAPSEVTLTAGSGTWAGQPVAPAPGAVTVSVTAATAAFTGVAVTPVPIAVVVGLTAAVFTAVAVAVTEVSGGTTYRPDDGVTAAPGGGATTARPFTGTTTAPAGGITARPYAGVTSWGGP